MAGWQSRGGGELTLRARVTLLPCEFEVDVSRASRVTDRARGQRTAGMSTIQVTGEVAA